jgi:hypothetical protein
MPDFDPTAEFEDLLPSDAVDDELGELRVNFTDKEASSKALDPIPRGEYHVKLTDIEVKRCGPESKNPGKPYWACEFTVQEGPYAERKVWSNVMLFNGALYSLSQMMKALGHNIDSGEFRVPASNTLIGKDFILKVTVKPETDQYSARNDVKGYKEYTGKAPTAGEASLLP